MGFGSMANTSWVPGQGWVKNASGGGLSDIVKQLQGAQNKANAANESRYQDMMKQYTSLQATSAASAKSQADSRSKSFAQTNKDFEAQRAAQMQAQANASRQNQAAQQQQTAQNTATSQAALDQLSGVGEAGMARIGRSESQAQAKSTQDLTSRGLGNTTITGAMSRGISDDAELQRQSLQEGVAAQKSGILMQQQQASNSLFAQNQQTTNSLYANNQQTNLAMTQQQNQTQQSLYGAADSAAQAQQQFQANLLLQQIGAMERKVETGPDLSLYAQLLQQAAQAQAQSQSSPSQKATSTVLAPGWGTPIGQSWAQKNNAQAANQSNSPQTYTRQQDQQTQQNQQNQQTSQGSITASQAARMLPNNGRYGGYGY